MSEEVVYVLGTPGSNTVKIGTTANLRKRLADIQRMSPVPLEAFWTCPGGRELETQLHRHFKEFRSHGEWFTFRRDPVRLIQWAVEGEPWSRPKISLKKAKPRPTSKPKPFTTPPEPNHHPAFDALMEFAATLDSELAAITDPLERYKAACEAERRHDFLQKAAAREIVLRLKAHGLTWREVGERLGFSGQRAHQISNYPPFEEVAA
jgi:hypothetical protein